MTITAELQAILGDMELRNIVRWQLVPRFRQSLGTQADASTRERSADEWFDGQWGDEGWRKRNCPGKMVLKKLRQRCQEKWGLTLNAKTLIDALTVCPADVADVARRIQSHFYPTTAGA